jgi:DNA-binding response OmpR family regulator
VAKRSRPWGLDRGLARGITRSVHVVVICADPERARRDPEDGSVAALLGDLGARLTIVGVDLADLAAVPRTPAPTAVVVEAGDDLARGHAIVRALRDGGDVLHDAPILLAVTLARLSAIDHAIGLTDFIVMPIVPAELYARIRRLDWQSSAFGSDEVIKIDDLVLDIAGREVRLAGRRIELTRQEFELLRCLAEHRGRVLPRAALLARAWGRRGGAATRTVDIHVRRVRSKLGHAGAVIETVRNVGYKLRG